MEGNLKPVTLGPWPKGMDNVSSDHAIAKDALRSAVNVDVTNDGSVRQRSGLTGRVAGVAHSIWDDGTALYAVVNGVLTRYTRAVSGALSGVPLRSGMSPDPVAYLELGGEVYYSNGIVNGKIVAGFHRPWGVERPSEQPPLAALTNGALDAGRYQVAETFVDAFGEESGTGPTTAVVVAAGGGISLTKIPQPVDPGIARIRIYVSEANGKVLYRYADLSVGTTTLTVTRSTTLGKVLDSQFLMPPLPGALLGSYNGRIYIARGNLVCYTEPLRYGAMRQRGFLPAFDDEVRILADGGVGLWVVTASRHTLLVGSGPGDFQPVEKLAYGAAKGAITKLPGDKRFWISSKGPVIANRQGEIQDLTDDAGDPLVHVAMDAGARGACAFKESRGIRQIIACVRGTGGRGLVAQDYIDLTGA